MKLLIASDIHGSAVYCRQLMDAVEREKPDKILLLGDLLYHGPRNALPEGYDPKAVAEALNGVSEKLLCVRGNCDAEVDQMLLTVPILSESALVFWEGQTLYATHGHKEFSALQKGEILLCGHTHIPAWEEAEGVWHLNPGSVSIPKENSWHGYLLLEGRTFFWKNLAGEIQKELTI